MSLRFSSDFNSHDCFQSATGPQKDLTIQPHLHQESSDSHAAECPFPITSGTPVISNLDDPPSAVNASEDVNEPDLDDDKITWLNLIEHDELAKCLDTCVD